MIFTPTKLAGAWTIDMTWSTDSRGSFGRTFCERELAERGLTSRFPQHSASRSSRKATLRGMHFQRAPHGEVKIVSCHKGAIWDAIIDLRPDSTTYKQWQGFELTADNRRQLYVPEGFAHGQLSLCDDTEVHYLISNFYEPAAASGVRFDDPSFEIDWPVKPAVVSERDAGWPLFA